MLRTLLLAGLNSAGECVQCNYPSEDAGTVCSNCDGDDPTFCTDWCAGKCADRCSCRLGQLLLYLLRCKLCARLLVVNSTCCCEPHVRRHHVHAVRLMATGRTISSCLQLQMADARRSGHLLTLSCSLRCCCKGWQACLLPCTPLNCRHRLPATLQCETNVDGCRACKPLEGVCDRCSPQQGLVGGACQDCEDVNCKSCNGNAASCVECDRGYHVDVYGLCGVVSSAAV